jgi:exopolysaccharide biosynthesis polyprenyl glycosylphosphotransferase
VGSITPIDARRSNAGSSPIDGAAIPPVCAENLLEAVDDGTRRALGRRPRRGRVLPAALMLADLVGLSLAYLLTARISSGRHAPGTTRELTVFAISLPCWVLLAALHGLYRRDAPRVDHTTIDEIAGILHVVAIGALLLLLGWRLAAPSGPDVLDVVVFAALAMLLVPATRLLARTACRRSRAYVQNTVIVGAGEVGQLVCRKLMKHPEYGANVVGFVDRHPRIRSIDLPEHLSILGGPERLAEIVEQLDVERVVIAFSNEPLSELLELVRGLRPLGVQIDVVPRLFEVLGPRVAAHSAEGLALLALMPAHPSKAALAAKRGIDIVGASVGLIVLAPLMAFFAWRIRRDSPGPALFRQTRLGTGMKPFTVLKFRTMEVRTEAAVHRDYIRKTMAHGGEADGNGLYKLDRADVVTGFGRWLRRTSLDELPQLVNVLRGEMSLVGPRPCIPYEADHFAPHHLERFLMPQGITGLWQVTARANATYREALDMDVAYVWGWSLSLDVRLLLRTPLELLRQRSATT